MKKILLSATFVISSVSPYLVSSTHAQKWADVTFTVKLDGEIPKPTLLNMAADPKCPQGKEFSEDLVVDEKSKGIANLVFMIDTKKTKLETSQLHPDLQAVPTDKPILDNLNCKFVPHVMAVRAGQTITVKNSDTTGHNANFSFFANAQVNPMIQAGGSTEVLTTTDEKSYTPVACNIHSWMKSYLYVLNHPYIGISDSNGLIKIEKLPAGVELDFKIWHESQDKSIEDLTLDGKKETWKKGGVKMTLKEGVNDFGTMLIKADRFKSKE
jgi:plastocyanin